MALKDRFRKAIGRPSDRSSSTSTASNHSTRPPTGTTTPNNGPETPLTSTSTNGTANNTAPAITLTKTHSRLTKTLTWRSTNKPSKEERKEKKTIEEWAKQDAEEWKAPKGIRGKRKDQNCQDTLRAFDFKQFERESLEQGRTRSVCSGISPSASRAGSVDDGGSLTLQKVLSAGRKRSSGAGAGPGKLSQEISQGDGAQAATHKQSVGTVQEE